MTISHGTPSTVAAIITGMLGENSATLDGRHLASGRDHVAGAIRFAGEIDVFVKPRGLVAVDEELAFLGREAVLSLADDQRVFAARKLGRQAGTSPAPMP